MNDDRVFSHFNRSAFLHVEYCQPKTSDSDFHMMKVWAGKTENGEVKGDAAHYLSFSRVRYLCFLLLSGNLENKDHWESIRGKKDPAKGVLCRILKIRRDDEVEDQPKFFFTVAVGPGYEGPNGIFLKDTKAPAQAWTFTTLVFDEEQMHSFALDLQAWVNAVTASLVHDLREARGYDILESEGYEGEGG